MEILVHCIHGPIWPILSKDVQAGRSSSTTSDRGTSKASSYNNGGSRSMGPSRLNPQVRVDQQDNRSSSHTCRQYQHEIGLEVLRQLNIRFALPVGTKSIGYLTKLLRPTFDSNNFEESFSNWEFELNKYEQDNNTQLPDQVKIAVLMNETKRPVQQHLHLVAGATPTYTAIRSTIMEYYAFTRFQQGASSSVSTSFNGGAAPMDIGAIKKKEKESTRAKERNERAKERKARKEKAMDTIAMATEDKAKEKDQLANKRTTKDSTVMRMEKEKDKERKPAKKQDTQPAATDVDNQATPQRTARLQLTNIQEDTHEGYNDATAQWYGPQTTYDNHWWTNDQSQVNAVQQPQQLTLPAPAQLDATPALQIAAGTVPTQQQQHSQSTRHEHDHKSQQRGASWSTVERQHMFGPFWFASTTQTYDIPGHERPNLRTATEDPIKVYGCKWVYMTNESNQQIVIPFYVCSISQPILSVTRLTEQGFTIHLSEHNHTPKRVWSKTTSKGRNILPACEQHRNTTKLQTRRTRDTTRNQSNNLTHHTDTRRNTMGDTPTWHLDLQRKNNCTQQDGTTEDFVEELHNLDHSKQKRKLDIAWKGETWFKVKKDARPPQPSIATQDTSSRALQHPISNSRAVTNKRRDTLGRSQRGLRRRQQAITLSNRHSKTKGGPSNQRMTIGHEKDTSGKEST